MRIASSSLVLDGPSSFLPIVFPLLQWRCGSGPFLHTRLRAFQVSSSQGDGDGGGSEMHVGRWFG